MKRLALVALLLGGCASTPDRWVRDDVSTWARDDYECQRDARTMVMPAYMSMGRMVFPVQPKRELNEMYGRCLRARGYQPVVNSD